MNSLPSQRAFRRRSMEQTMAEITRQHIFEAGGAAGNVADADLQGTDPADFSAFRRVLLRLSPLSWQSTGELLPEDWMLAHLIQPRGVRRVARGAYAELAGSRWLVFKTRWLGAVTPTLLLRRCNAVMQVFCPGEDFTQPGEWVSVPISVLPAGGVTSGRYSSASAVLTEHTPGCICQRNDETRGLVCDGRRVRLGSGEYTVRCLNDYTRESTFDEDSTHLMTFTLDRRLEEPNRELLAEL